MEVTFETTDDWGLVTTVFWVGDNITGVPFDEGSLDTESFPYYWCNSTGATAHTTHIDFKWLYLCEEEGEFSLAVVAQVAAAKLSQKGKAIEGTEIISFISEYEIDLMDDSFGWFDVPVTCTCEPKKKKPVCPDGDMVPEITKSECHGVLGVDSMPVGFMCVELSTDGDSLEVTFKSTEGWGLITTDFWVGENIKSVPQDHVGSLDIESFPYYWCNSTGETVHSTKIDFKWGYLCDEESEFSLSIVAQLAMAELSQIGKAIEGTEIVSFVSEYEIDLMDDSFGWFDVPVTCACKKPVCVEGEPKVAKEECHNVLAGDNAPVGSMCVGLANNGKDLDVTFQSTGDWGLITTEVWVGDNVHGVPFDEEGSLDVESFPYFWCNSTGETSHSTHVDFKWAYLCEEKDEFSLAVVAQVTLAKLSNAGKAIEGTEVVSFASEYEIDLKDDTFGWFDIPVTCACEPKKCPYDMEPEITKAECHNIMGQDSMPVGSMCVGVFDLKGSVSASRKCLWNQLETGVLSLQFGGGDNVTSVPLMMMVPLT
eukprot:Sro115_g056710.2  (538) ;mRNA; f:37333-38946